MQIILFTYSCILMKNLENDNNCGHNNVSVPHGQYLINTFFDRSINVLSVSYTVLIRFIRYIYVTRTAMSVS